MVQILIADDDQNLRDMATRTLEQEGHTITSVGDGEEALVYITQADELDVLIADVDMPGLDGISLAKKARVLKPTLRVLIISGMSERLDEVGTIDGPPIATLQKPFSLEALRAALSKLLG